MDTNDGRIITVTDRWNHKVRIAKVDFENKKKLIVSVYNRNEIRICDSKTYKYSRDFGTSFIHKANILGTSENAESEKLCKELFAKWESEK